MSNSHLFLKSTFIKTPSQNGVGRYVCQLQRVVLKFCKSHGASRGIRDFIESDIVEYAKQQPGVVMYLKPRRHRSPAISAEFLNGDKTYISCHNLTREEVGKWLNLLTTQSGNSDGTRLRKLMHTDFPSIQGPWTPFTFGDPSLNLAKYPDEELSKPLNQSKSASDKLLELFNEQKKNLKDLETDRAQ